MNAQPSMTAPLPVEAPRKPRNSAFDFTKGALVLFMVLYHSLNYFRADRGGVYLTYLRFLSPSFIFISGFLITHIYRSKYQPSDWRLHKRLLIRGLKLLAVFIILNFAVNLVVSRNFNGAQFGVASFCEQLPAILGTGRERAVFEVLVPIAYLLMMGGPLLLLHAKFRGALAMILVTSSLAACFLAMPNLEYVCFGILGALWGLVPLATLNRWTNHWIILCAAYLAYLGVLRLEGATFFVLYFGVCLTEALLYRLGVQVGEGAAVGDCVILLGRYSLLAYIAQIFILQSLLRLFRHWPQTAENWPLGLFVALILTIITVIAADGARRRWPWANRIYNLVFG